MFLHFLRCKCRVVYCAVFFCGDGGGVCARNCYTALIVQIIASLLQIALPRAAPFPCGVHSSVSSTADSNSDSQFS
uniref:Putative secreted protein n=1 Tax=Anopheles triannulatus TaxID=58253 RepID=A0A2M4B1Q9_9DIPT